jgi:hypothetical protein
MKGWGVSGRAALRGWGCLMKGKVRERRAWLRAWAGEAGFSQQGLKENLNAPVHHQSAKRQRLGRRPVLVRDGDDQTPFLLNAGAQPFCPPSPQKPTVPHSRKPHQSTRPCSSARLAFLAASIAATALLVSNPSGAVQMAAPTRCSVVRGRPVGSWPM